MKKTLQQYPQARVYIHSPYTLNLSRKYVSSKEIKDAVIRAIETEIGKIARPKNVYIVPDMPKTRSGKLMRRVLADISNGRSIGDVATLANAEIVQEIRKMVQE